jgi:hypothetical protein
MYEFLKGYLYESDEKRIEELFKSIDLYIRQIPDNRVRIDSIHYLIKKLRGLSTKYQSNMDSM